MSAGLELLLARLDRVKPYGRGYRAVCPACGGKNASKLSVSDSDDGRVLLHCFSGCEAAAVVAAAGLQLSDLFPERLVADTPDERKRRARMAREAQWGAALEMLELEVGVVYFAAVDVAAGKPLSDTDLARVQLAHQRLSDARNLLKPAPAFRPSLGIPA